jgi:hypothetical protein
MTNEAFDAAKRLRESEVPSSFENPDRRFGNAFKKKGDHPAATAHLTRRKIVMGMARQTRVLYTRDLRVSFKKTGDFERVRSMFFHAQRQGFEDA